MKLIACTVGAVLMLAAASPSTSEPAKTPHVEIGRGALLRGPITIRDDSGRPLLTLRPGEVLGETGTRGCADTLTVEHGRQVHAAESHPLVEGHARSQTDAVAVPFSLHLAILGDISSMRPSFAAGRDRAFRG